MSSTATPKQRRPYRIDAQVASERGRKAAAARNSPDCYIRCLARATLNAAQKRRLIELAASFLADPGDPAGDP